MSLVRKRKVTEKNLSANRVNGRKSRGAVTAAGKARIARGKLRHGFYAQADQDVLTALGEDPAEYQRLVRAFQTDLTGAMESQVVGRIARAFWRMQRAERMQDGLALKRVRHGMVMEELMVSPQTMHIYQIFENLCALGRRINSPDPLPSGQEIEDLIDAFGPEPPEKIRKIFPLYRAYWEVAWKASPPSGAEGNGADASAAELEKKAAREKLDAVLTPVSRHYCQTQDLLMENLDRVTSPENIAALMAPKDENSMLMQRMEDSSLRQLWRLTNILVKVRKGALNQEDTEHGK